MSKKTNLEDIGFSMNKTKVYEALLSLGTAPASVIAQKSGIVRSTVYQLLKELIHEGLAESVNEKVKKFTAAHPHALMNMIEGKRLVVERMLPGLLGIFAAPKFKPRMRFYEGIEGKKKVFEDILALNNDVVYTFSPIHEVLTLFGSVYSRHFTEKRVKNKIRRHALRPNTAMQGKASEWEFYSSDEKLMREIRLLPPTIKCDTLIQIYANKISVVAAHEDYAFIVESAELAGLMKQIFLFLWNSKNKTA